MVKRNRVWPSLSAIRRDYAGGDDSVELVFVLIWFVVAMLWMGTKGGDRFNNRTDESTRHYWNAIDNRRDPWA